MSIDWRNLQQRSQKLNYGTIANPLQLDGLPRNADTKQIGTKLNEIADNSRTGGQYEEIGSSYGFTLLVKTEISEKEGVDLNVNSFFGAGRRQYQVHIQ